MRVRTTRIVLHFILLFMNAGFILYTLQRQGSQFYTKKEIDKDKINKEIQRIVLKND